MNEKYIHFNRSVDVYRSSPWCCCVGAGPGSSDLLQDKTQKSRVFFWYDPNRPTTVFLHNERTDRKQSLSRHLIHYYISILSLVISFFADRNQSTNECPGEPRRNSLLPASLTNSHPDSAIYSNVSGFPKSQDQPDELGVALIKDTHPVMYSTIDDQN